MFMSLAQEFDRVAREAPRALALSWRTSAWTYGQLSRAAAAVRARLHADGIPKGSHVALLVRNSPHYVASYLGTLAHGCVAMPLNVQERASVLERQVQHAQCSAVIADPQHPEWVALAQALGVAGLPVILLDLHANAGDPDALCLALGATNAELQPDSVGADVPAMLIYTSGTTSHPKGVLLSHGNLAANANAIAGYLQIEPSDKVLCGLPFHFSYGSSVLNSNLIRGAHLLLEETFAFPQQTLKRMQDEGVTGFPGVPSTFALLLGRCNVGEFDLGSLRYVTQAGGSMPRAQIELLRKQLPHTRVFIMYGQTEATARLTYLSPQYLETKLGSVGKPLSGIEIEILDAAGNPVPTGETGEIRARGPNVMLGYWREAEMTANVLRDGWLHTGDLGHRDADGFLYIDGRAVEMIKVGAFRVSPQEVEEVLAAFPGVEEVAVTGIADEMLGQSIKAVIVLREGVAADLRGVKAHCRQHLASYKIPKVVEFVAELPRTSTGKVQRLKLA